MIDEAGAFARTPCHDFPLPQPSLGATLRPFVGLTTSQQPLVSREGTRAMPRSSNRAVGAASAILARRSAWPRLGGMTGFPIGWMLTAVIVWAPPVRGQGAQRASEPQPANSSAEPTAARRPLAARLPEAEVAAVRAET